MKKILLIMLCQVFIVKLQAQIVGSLNPLTANKFQFTGNFNGFNDGQSSSESGMGVNATQGPYTCGSCDGAVHPLFYDLQDDLQYFHRFPGGTVANYYHRYLAGSGYTSGGVQYNNPFYKVTASSYNSCFGVNQNDCYYMKDLNPPTNNSNNNMIFPFINKLTHNRSSGYSSSSNYVLNLLEHYRKYTINGTTYNPRGEIFNQQIQNEIVRCSTYALLQGSSLLSSQFKNIVYENLDALKTLIDNNITIKNIELGNELFSFCASTTNASNTQQNYNGFINGDYVLGIGVTESKIWYCEPLATVDVRTYGPRTTFTLDCFRNLCSMYVGIIKTYFPNNTFKFGITSGRFDYVGGNVNKWAFIGFNNAWFHYLIFPNKNVIGYDAIVVHPYPGPADSVDLSLNNNAFFSAAVPKIDTKLAQLISRTVLDSMSLKLPQNTNIWVTEWNWSQENNAATDNSLRINNTMLDIYGKSEFLFAMIDGNTYNINRKNLYSIANHQYFNSNTPVWYTVAVNLPYGGTLFKRATYYTFKLMQPVIDNKAGYQYNTIANAGFTSVPAGVKFRSFYKSGGNCNYDVGELLLYYANTSGTEYTININNYLAAMFTSNPTYYIPSGLVYNYGTWADKFYASCGASYSTTSEPGNTDAYYVSNPTDALKNIQIVDAYLTNPQDVSNFKIKNYAVGYLRIPIRQTVGIISCVGRLANPNTTLISEPENKFNIYPNPAKDKISIDLFSTQKSVGNIEIYNMEGKMVQTDNVELSEGNNSTQIDVSTLPSASYIVKLNYNETSVSKKIEIIK